VSLSTLHNCNNLLNYSFKREQPQWNK